MYISDLFSCISTRRATKLQTLTWGFDWVSGNEVNQPDVFSSVHVRVLVVTRFHCLSGIVTNTKQSDHNDSECASEISLCMSENNSVVQGRCFAVGLLAVLDSRLVTRYVDNHTGITCHDRSQWAPTSTETLECCRANTKRTKKLLSATLATFKYK